MSQPDSLPDQMSAHQMSPHLFVDDASKDGTRKALVGLKNEIPELKVFAHTKNSGQSRAVRSGVLKARGEIIGIVSALCWASATLINKRAALPLSSWALSFWQMLVGAIADHRLLRAG